MQASTLANPLAALPDGWRIVRLAATAQPGPLSFIDGDWIEAPYITDEGIRLVQTGNIGLGRFLDRSDFRKFISERSFRALGCKWVYPGDILICRLADPIGRTCIVPNEVGRCVTAVDCTVYRPRREIVDRSFAVHLLNSDFHLRRLADVAGGSTRQRISRGNLGAVALVLPPLPEQRRIGEILDMVDATIHQTEALIAKLKQMKAGLLHDLLTRGLNEHGQLRDPVAHPEQFKDSSLGRVPNDWEVQSLAQCARPDAPITYGIVQAGLHVEEGVPYIRTGDMAGDRLKSDGLLRTSPQVAALYRRSEVRAGEIVCAIRATVGKVLEVPVELDGANLTQGTARIALRSNINSRFVLWSLQSGSAKRQFDLAVKGTTFPEITLRDLRKIQIAIPSNRSEQDGVVAVLDAHDARIRAEEAYRDKLKLLKKGLMDDLLTGRVRVNTLEEVAV